MPEPSLHRDDSPSDPPESRPSRIRRRSNPPPEEPETVKAKDFPRPRTPAEQQKFLRSLALEWFLVLASAITLALIVHFVFIGMYAIPSESMVPTLIKGDRVIVNRLSYSIGGSVERGDVVVFKRPEAAKTNRPDEPEDLVKRVIALSGQTVEARNGVVYVDGEQIDESYLPADVVTTNLQDPVTVPTGKLFVMGDNREHSFDSRSFGPISEDDVEGRAFVRIWPLPRLGGL